MTHMLRWLCIAAAVIWASGFMATAQAHHIGGAPHGTGIIIPGVSHGQMQALAQSRSAILALADQQPAPDQTSQRLRNFIELQHAACLWMVVPATVSDEASPFNECAHAELAAALALLVHMMGLPGPHDQAAALKATIQHLMLTDPSAWATCRYGNEEFTSDRIVFAHLGTFAARPSTMLTVFASVLLLVGCAVVLKRSEHARHRIN